MGKTIYPLRINNGLESELWEWAKENAKLNMGTLKQEIMMGLALRKETLLRGSRSPQRIAPDPGPDIEDLTEDDLFNMEFSKFWKLGYRMHKAGQRDGVVFDKGLSEKQHRERGQGVTVMPAWIVDRNGDLVDPDKEWEPSVSAPKYDANGFDEMGRDKDGFDLFGVDKNGFDREGNFTGQEE